MGVRYEYIPGAVYENQKNIKEALRVVDAVVRHMLEHPMKSLGVVTLNLAAMVDDVASRLGLPKNLGAKLPPHIANLTVLKSNQLKVVQNGGARLAPELRVRLRRALNCTPQEIYGTAEGLINMTRLDDDDERLLHSSGAPVCDADEIVVVDDDGREVPDGEAGELMTRGPYTIRGYYDAAEKNADAFTEDGFYRMGDIVRRRGRYLYAEGRRKDFVNRGGEKISCEEIEALMLTHPKVKLAALVAMPDPVFGEKACAFVVPHPGETLGLAELIAFLRAQQIAAFKLPERLEIVAELPLSPVGKILKRELREMIAAKLAQEQPR